MSMTKQRAEEKRAWTKGKKDLARVRANKVAPEEGEESSGQSKSSKVKAAKSILSCLSSSSVKIKKVSLNEKKLSKNQK